MASIIKRKKNYSIVYNYTDENGETRQKWETRTCLLYTSSGLFDFPGCRLKQDNLALQATQEFFLVL